MFNGEAIRENSSHVASPKSLGEFSPWRGHKLDTEMEENGSSPTSSNYSSCEGSEFERYCSANSIIGTASVCSSVGNCNEFLSSDLGSLWSLAAEETRRRIERNEGDVVSCGFERPPSESCKENENIENGAPSEERKLLAGVGNWQKLLMASDGSSSLVANSEENSDMQPGSYRDICEESSIGNLSTLPTSPQNLMLSRDGTDSNSLPSSAGKYLFYEDIDAENNDESLIQMRVGSRARFFAGSDEDSQSELDVSQEKNIDDFAGEASSGVGFCLQRESSEYDGETETREVGVAPETDVGTSSRCEQLDDDDSLDFGTDDEDQRRSHSMSNLQYFRESKTENENPLLINSSVAFGAGDWDEFEQEVEGNKFSLSHRSLTYQQWPLETETDLLDTLDSAPIPGGTEQPESVRDIPVASCQTEAADESLENKKSCSLLNLTEEDDLQSRNPDSELYSLVHADAAKSHLSINADAPERELQCICSEEVTVLRDDDVLDKELLPKSELVPDHTSDIMISQGHSTATEAFQGSKIEFSEDHKLNMLSVMADESHNIVLKKLGKESAASMDVGGHSPATKEVGKLDADDFYDDMVHEMEEILLDSGVPHGARFTQIDRSHLSQHSLSFRDGSPTASTSGKDEVHSPIQIPQKIDWVEVVGAKQKKGDVSLGERLVGVKEYTVYKLKVWGGKDQWEVERRYRDFFTLYRQLKTFFVEHGEILPSPWTNVERESRKIFGNASPDVISERSTLIQECLRSILQSKSSLGIPSSLVRFLSPSESPSDISVLSTQLSQPIKKLQHDENSNSLVCGETCTKGASTLGKTISLLVDIQPRKSMKQLLEAQHYSCAGCHKCLDAGKSLVQGVVQSFGWGKPRFCEYTGQLFCTSCHTNETAVLPAKVLHLWDFSLYPVSQLAKAYLESIYDQPMLCVSAVNPFLFSKVPALLHVMGIRKKIGTMVPYVRCPFRRSIQRGLGSRRYLLESNGFFALRDLVDLSKGAFAALPVIVETVSEKVFEHITQRCLVCCDVGIPCNARQACEDPSSLIFPFQEESEVARCSSCDSVFHKSCFGKLLACPCGAPTEVDNIIGPAEWLRRQSSNDLNRTLDTPSRRHDAKSGMGFLSDLFSKAKQESTWSSRNNNPVILMGSLPSSSM